MCKTGIFMAALLAEYGTGIKKRIH